MRFIWVPLSMTDRDVEPKMRIELTTYALRVRCSTPELPGRVTCQPSNSISLNILFGPKELFREVLYLGKECIMASGSTDRFLRPAH